MELTAEEALRAALRESMRLDPPPTPTPTPAPAGFSSPAPA